MTTFDDRANAFESKFAHDAEMQFRAEARCNKLTGLWAAEILGIIPSGAKADSGGDSQRAESLNLWRQVLGGHGHGYSDRIAGGF